MQLSIHHRKLELSFIIIALSLLVKLLCIGSNDLLAEEAYYWNYSAHLDIGYLDHPPMVAVLIKIFTTLFGTNEFAVRFASILCWFATAFFSFKFTQLIKPGAGIYAVMLLSILPFFFLHSLVITPDLPLIVCWSAAIYYLYRAQVLDQSYAWYVAGLWLGLGLLSKYTIVLTGCSALCYLVMVPHARTWFLRKEPYLCLLITALLFTPVIYWNATHNWASFAFQSTRRLEEDTSFTFHQLLGLFVVFLTPLGVSGFLSLFRTNTPERGLFDINTRRFLQLYTLVPLAVFSVFSFRHEIKFNWIGPSLLGIIPWLAILIDRNTQPWLRRGWVATSAFLLLIYSAMLFCIVSGKPARINQELFIKYIAWSDLTRQVHTIASEIEASTKSTPLIVAMDPYNIASELAFYQADFLAHGTISTAYKVIGSDLFGNESLMYRYWSKGVPVDGKTLILVNDNRESLETPEVNNRVIVKSDTREFWSHAQGQGENLRKFYYKIVQLKDPASIDAGPRQSASK